DLMNAYETREENKNRLRNKDPTVRFSRWLGRSRCTPTSILCLDAILFSRIIAVFAVIYCVSLDIGLFIMSTNTDLAMLEGLFQMIMFFPQAIVSCLALCARHAKIMAIAVVSQSGIALLTMMVSALELSLSQNTGNVIVVSLFTLILSLFTMWTFICAFKQLDENRMRRSYLTNRKERHVSVPAMPH
ncbi:hypothetical protein PFISCL1PPCAC_17924, partial [Pristionchus fissidentatus]